MKNKTFKAVEYNNRKKQLYFTYSSGKMITVHYGKLGIKENIMDAWIDKETKNKSIGLELSNGKKDFIPFDQPLFLSEDPEFLLRTHIELILAQIKKALKKRRISKHYLAEQLNTSDNQIHRLLNPSILNKNLEQLYKIASLLDLELEIKLKSAA